MQYTILSTTSQQNMHNLIKTLFPSKYEAQPMDIEPKELLERFKHGERPGYKHKDDKIVDELNMLAEQYKQSMTVQNKGKLLDKEREILFEEMKKPELTLARNYNQILHASAPERDAIFEAFDDVLRLMNVTALQREAYLQNRHNFHCTKISKENIDTLKDVYMEACENNNIALTVKNFILEILALYKEDYPELSDKIEETYKYLYQNTNHPDLKDNIKSYNEEHTIDYCMEQLTKDNCQYEYFLNEVLNNADRKNERVAKLVSDLLVQEDVPDNIMRRAILGAGKFRSDENFEILKNIALNINEPDIRKREFAIQSAALYLKDKPEEVKNIISKVSKENSVFAPLGRILLDKVNGNYHGQVDRELNYAGIGPNRKKDFRYHFKKFFVSENNLSKKKINSLHENTVPFINYLNKLSRDRKYLIISDNDTITKHLPDYIGKRYIKPGAIMNSGGFYDSYDGINTTKYSIMSTSRIGDTLHQNQVAHETGHALHSILNDEQKQMIEELFEKAKKECRTLDYYADSNSHEYFAQGCDAFASYYKPHKQLMNNSGLGHTVYELMDKDPDLFKFIQKVLKQYLRKI